MALKTRHQLKEGSKLKIPEKIYTGVDNQNQPFWKFSVPFAEEYNGEISVYEWIWVKCQGRFTYNTGDWVVIDRIISYTSMVNRNELGGKQVYKQIECSLRR